MKEEVLHIQEYIELEKIRFQDTLKVEFESSPISEEMQIAPMLLIPFVENAFKHGNLIDGFLRIKIRVEVGSNQLSFFIKNTVKEFDSTNEKSGIGLENIRKRLELNYGNNYQLTNEVVDKWYIVNLTITNLNIIENE